MYPQLQKIIFAAALLLTVTVACGAQSIPSVKLKNIEGKTIDTGKLRNNGNPIVISFFATWCKPCMRELTAIDAMFDEWEEQTGVRFILVSIDDAQNVQKVRPLVDGQGWDFEVLLDVNSERKRLMQVQQIPHVFVFDGNGKMVYNHSGYTDGSENDLYQKILEVSKKK